MIRVLVVDDSPTVLAFLVRLFESGGFEVVGTAQNGIAAVQQAARLHPDVVSMDVHMPELNGIEAVKRIMAETPMPIVVVSASARTQGRSIVFEALQAGAVAVVDKPPGEPHVRHTQMVAELLRTVRLMAGVEVVRRSAQPPFQTSRPGAPRRDRLARPVAILIAASTGGPPALQEVLRGLGDHFDVPVLIVQHISWGFSAGMATWLDATCPQRVRLAEHGERPAGGTVYLAPDDAHLIVTGFGKIALSKAPAVGAFALRRMCCSSPPRSTTGRTRLGWS